MLQYVTDGVQEIFETYMSIFFLLMLTRFARERKGTLQKDEILGRMVPSIVYCMNQGLLKEAIRDNAKLNSELRSALI